MKMDWKKQEKEWYLPGRSPGIVRVPAMGFFCIKGEGNPNGPEFTARVEVLYALAYGVKMSPRQGTAPDGYVEYSVYPLEGLWDLRDEARGGKPWTKDDLAYTIMIRQPDFVGPAYAQEVLERVGAKKKLSLLGEAWFEVSEEGLCAQMLHVGRYDDEPASFERLESFVEAQGQKRRFMTHREIYLSDARKTAPEKLRTVLRIQLG